MVTDLGGALAATMDPAGLARFVSRGRWRLVRHLEFLNGRLVELSTGASGRLVVCMPPRHGKSELCSVYLPAWYLGTHPERRVILAGHEADFGPYPSGNPLTALLETVKALRLHRAEGLPPGQGALGD